MPISPGEIAANRDALDALMREPPVPAVPKMTTLMAVTELAPQIRSALKLGHPLAEIAKRLRLGGRTLGAEQLQRYLGRCEKRAARKPSSRRTAPPSTDAAAPRPTPRPSPSSEAQGATGSAIQHAPTVQAPTVVRSTPPTAVTTPATTTPTMAATTPVTTPVATGGATGTRTGATAGPATIGQDHRTATPNAASASTSTSTAAKPQSTASPELPGLSYEAARSRTVDRMLGTARPGANVDQPRPSNLTGELHGQPKPSSADGARTEPPLGSTTRP
ncbi:hypothetical protein ACQKQD_06920 [Methylobacterium sp. NPDC080182]|uniref:hypothetical protein n=1 Tax=Methylobacterium sp. NPDC080182 TaxID=3390590 RepID=UPI003D08EB8E